MIHAVAIHKRFGENLVLQGVDLKVDKGEVICLIGGSGSGKSTFLRCLNGLEIADSGSVTLGGTELLSPTTDIDQFRQRIGMVFQHFNLFNNYSVLDNVTLGPRKLKGMSKEQAELMAVKLLERVGLGHRVNSAPHQLSGGQKQRVAIARALAMNPDALLFDEPTSALDPEMVREVLEVIRQLVKEGMTMIIVTHEMNFAREIADRVAFMHEGKIVEISSAETLFSHPRHPATQSFLAKIL